MEPRWELVSLLRTHDNAAGSILVARADAPGRRGEVEALVFMALPSMAIPERCSGWSVHPPVSIQTDGRCCEEENFCCLICKVCLAG